MKTKVVDGYWQWRRNKTNLLFLHFEEKNEKPRAAGKMLYPNWLVSDPDFRVAVSSEYPDMRCLPRLEYEAASGAISGKTFFSRP